MHQLWHKFVLAFRICNGNEYSMPWCFVSFLYISFFSWPWLYWILRGIHKICSYQKNINLCVITTADNEGKTRQHPSFKSSRNRPIYTQSSPKDWRSRPKFHSVRELTSHTVHQGQWQASIRFMKPCTNKSPEQITQTRWSCVMPG